MPKFISIMFEVDDSVEEDAFVEAVTVQLHEVRVGEQDDHNKTLDQIINVGHTPPIEHCDQLRDITIILSEIDDPDGDGEHSSSRVYRYDFQGNHEDLELILQTHEHIFIEGSQMSNTKIERA